MHTTIVAILDPDPDTYDALLVVAAILFAVAGIWSAIERATVTALQCFGVAFFFTALMCLT